MEMKFKGFLGHTNVHYFLALLAIELSSCSKGSESDLNTEWSFCHGGLGYSDQAHTLRQPDKDWICALPEHPNDQRCVKIQEKICQGGTLSGSHDVPTSVGAWGSVPNTDGDDVKCLCGCFAGDTNIATLDGAEAISTLAEAAKYQDVAVLTRSRLGNLSEFIKSPEMRGGDFLNGLEDKPLIGIMTESGHSLDVTSKHPILVLTNRKQVLKQASELILGDTLLEANGTPTKIKAIISRKSQLVYNFDTKSKNLIEHIVLANGLQVGDNRLQNMLHDLEQRIDKRANGDLSYLENILK